MHCTKRFWQGATAGRSLYECISTQCIVQSEFNSKIHTGKSDHTEAQIIHRILWMLKKASYTHFLISDETEAQFIHWIKDFIIYGPYLVVLKAVYTNFLIYDQTESQIILDFVIIYGLYLVLCKAVYHTFHCLWTWTEYSVQLVWYLAVSIGKGSQFCSVCCK